MSNIEKMIVEMENWVKKVIVKYNICPFARKEVERGSIRYCVVEQSKTEDVLLELIKECEYLTNNSETETTLFIVPNGFESFHDFLDLVDMANDLLFDQALEGIYQLANFHPDYCFAGEPQQDAANYTNRSPHPCLHIIREESMEKALDAHPDPDAIPERNIDFCRKKGGAFFADLLAGCMNKK